MKLANAQLDYLVLPDEASAKAIQQTVSQNYINRHLPALRTKVIEGKWEKILGPIQTDEDEFVEIYKRLDDRVASQPRSTQYGARQ